MAQNASVVGATDEDGKKNKLLGANGLHKLKFGMSKDSIINLLNSKDSRGERFVCKEVSIDESARLFGSKDITKVLLSQSYYDEYQHWNGIEIREYHLFFYKNTFFYYRAVPSVKGRKMVMKNSLYLRMQTGEKEIALDGYAMCILNLIEEFEGDYCLEEIHEKKKGKKRNRKEETDPNKQVSNYDRRFICTPIKQRYAKIENPRTCDDDFFECVSPETPYELDKFAFSLLRVENDGIELSVIVFPTAKLADQSNLDSAVGIADLCVMCPNGEIATLFIQCIDKSIIKELLE